MFKQASVDVEYPSNLSWLFINPAGEKRENRGLEAGNMTGTCSNLRRILFTLQNLKQLIDASHHYLSAVHEKAIGYARKDN